MYLKRFFLLASFTLIAAMAKAQIGFGPEVGIGMATMKFAPPLTPIAYTAASVSPVLGVGCKGTAAL